MNLKKSPFKDFPSNLTLKPHFINLLHIQSKPWYNTKVKNILVKFIKEVCRKENKIHETVLQNR